MMFAVSVPGIIGGVFGALAALVLLYILAAYIAFYLLVVKPPVFDINKPNALMGEDFPAFVKKTREDVIVLKKFPAEEVCVTTRDGLTLRGVFYPSPEKSDITIVCLHGYNSSGYGEFGSRGLEYLRNGYNILLVNHRHHGGSDGKYIGFGVLDRHDVLCWLEAVNKLVPDGKIIISGVSMGGATAMQCSCLALPENVKGIIEDCGYTSVKEEFEFQCKRAVGFVPKLLLKGVDFFMKRFAKYGMDEINSVDAVRHSKVPILFIHGDEDIFVPTEMVYRCYDACTADKELYVVKGAAHAMAEFKGGDEYMIRVNEFISSCVGSSRFSTQ